MRIFSALFLSGLLATPGLALERMELLPGDASVTVHVSNTAQMYEALKASPCGRMLRDPAIQDFLGNPSLDETVEKMLDSEDEKQKEKSHLMFEMLKMLKGEVAVAFSKDGDMFILGWLSEDDYQKSLKMDRRIAELSPDKMRITRERFQGVDLYKHSEFIPGEEESYDETYIAYVGNTVVQSEDKEWVQRIIARLKRSRVNEPSGIPAVSATMNLRQMMRESATGPDGEVNDEAAAEMERVFRALGVDGFGVLKFSLLAEPTKLKMTASFPVGKLDGVMSVVSTEPSSTSLRVPFVSGDTVSYSVGRIDLNALWKAVPNIIMQMVEDPSQQASAIAMLGQAQTMLGVDPATELLAHIGTQYISTMAISDTTPVELHALEVVNEDALKSTLAKVFAETSPVYASVGQMLKTDEIRGHTIYRFSAPGEEREIAAITVAGGYLMMGNASAVQRALQGLTSPQSQRFYNRPSVRQLRRFVPARAISFGIVDIPLLVRAVASRSELIDDVKVGRMLKQEFDDSPFEMLAEGIDMSKLPAADHLASFFGAMFSYIELRDGVMMGEVVLLYPEGM